MPKKRGDQPLETIPVPLFLGGGTLTWYPINGTLKQTLPPDPDARPPLPTRFLLTDPSGLEHELPAPKSAPEDLKPGHQIRTIAIERNRKGTLSPAPAVTLIQGEPRPRWHAPAYLPSRTWAIALFFLALGIVFLSFLIQLTAQPYPLRTAIEQKTAELSRDMPEAEAREEARRIVTSTLTPDQRRQLDRALAQNIQNLTALGTLPIFIPTFWLIGRTLYARGVHNRTEDHLRKLKWIKD